MKEMLPGSKAGITFLYSGGASGTPDSRGIQDGPRPKLRVASVCNLPGGPQPEKDGKAKVLPAEGACGLWWLPPY